MTKKSKTSSTRSKYKAGDVLKSPAEGWTGSDHVYTITIKRVSIKKNKYYYTSVQEDGSIESLNYDIDNFDFEAEIDGTRLATKLERALL